MVPMIQYKNNLMSQSLYSYPRSGYLPFMRNERYFKKKFKSNLRSLRGDFSLGNKKSTRVKSGEYEG